MGIRTCFIAGRGANYREMLGRPSMLLSKRNHRLALGIGESPSPATTYDIIHVISKQNLYMSISP